MKRWALTVAGLFLMILAALTVPIMTLMERSQVAERPEDGSRGLQPTVFDRPGSPSRSDA